MIEKQILEILRENPQIYIRTSCREKFLNLVSPYVCDSMHYKLEL